MKITVLIENTSDCALAPEHGLSLLIEHGGAQILLDAGSTSAFCGNAAELKIDLAKIDIAVLSHGHYDHSGGFEGFFRLNGTAKVYAQESALDDYFSAKGGMHEISVPKEAQAHKNRFVLVSGGAEILDGVYLVPHTVSGLEKIGEKAGLFKEKDGVLIPDDFTHEHSLVFDTENGLVIFNSCSHGGVANIIDEARAFCGGKKVYAYIGGMHMNGRVNGCEVCAFTDAEINALCQKIIDENIAYVYTGHCTGGVGYARLKEKLGTRLHRLKTGIKFII